MTEEQLRKEARKFAENQMGCAPHDCSDYLDEKEHMIEYLLGKILGKDPYKCFCDGDKPSRLQDKIMVCCECEKPIN